MPKKVEEIMKAIKKKNPRISKSKAWAFAWSAYKKSRKV